MGIAAEAIHGNKSQNHRERVLAAFRSGDIRTLVATDIAARGIDVDGITHVVNFDIPNVPETYVHRIGRTARAGADGVAISLCAGEEHTYVRDIEKLIRLSLPKEDRRTPGQQRPAAASPSQHRSGRPPQTATDHAQTTRHLAPRGQGGAGDVPTAAMHLTPHGMRATTATSALPPVTGWQQQGRRYSGRRIPAPRKPPCSSSAQTAPTPFIVRSTI